MRCSATTRWKRSRLQGPQPTTCCPSQLRQCWSVRRGLERMDGILRLILNFWYCGGWETPSALEHPRELTGSQKDFLSMHLLPALERVVEGDPIIPKFKDLERLLSQKGQDYQGNSWVVMEELQCDKVVRCWPEPGAAAVQPLTRFLDGETKLTVDVPKNTILPYVRWKTPQAKQYFSNWQSVHVTKQAAPLPAEVVVPSSRLSLLFFWLVSSPSCVQERWFHFTLQKLQLMSAEAASC